MSSMATSSSSASSSSSCPPCVATAEDEAYDKTARALLEEYGFDPEEDVNMACRVRGFGYLFTTFYTPINYFSRLGNLQMCRYLILCRGADCRATDAHGLFPLYFAAANGHLEIVQFLCHECGAHDDIRKQIWNGWSPLSIALSSNHFDVVHWLILNGALSSSLHDAVDGGGIDDAIMRNDLRPQQNNFCHNWQNDKRLTVLAWAHDAVAKYENVKLFLTGTIMPASLSVCRHPKNPYATRCHKRMKVVSPSPLVILKGKSGILELIAHYIAGTPQQLRTLRQLINRLPAFIANVPFVIEEEDEDEADY